MRQDWLNLLFLHWPVDPNLVRPLTSSRLEVDTFEGLAWIGIVPFLLRNLRFRAGPPLPWVSSLQELNVRTYVHYKGFPGVWFLSLNADRRLVVWAANLLLGLPYLQADIQAMSSGGVGSFFLNLRPGRLAAGRFNCTWRTLDAIPPAAPHSLEFFLTERYCLYSVHQNRLLRMRIHHSPFVLKNVHLDSLQSNLVSTHGLPEPDQSPLLHFSECAEVSFWMPEVLS